MNKSLLDDRKQAANTACTFDGRDSKGRFAKGNSGRPIGSRNRATRLAEAALADMVDDAMNGLRELVAQRDPMAVRLVIERLLPRAVAPPPVLNLPELDGSFDEHAAKRQVLSAMYQGDISAIEARDFIEMIEEAAKALDAAAWETLVPNPTKALRGP